MKLPAGDRALIDPSKVRDYLLSPSHPVGRFKAVFFAAVGFEQGDWRLLVAELARLASEGEAMPTEASDYGQKYEIRGTIAGPLRQVGHDPLCMDRAHRRSDPTIRDSAPRELAMKFKILDTVVLDRDLPERGLRKGDLGAIVETHEPDGIEVEFVTVSGRTEALITLAESDVRAVADRDLIAVRTFGRSA
jgi:hypothetical protein